MVSIVWIKTRVILLSMLTSGYAGSKLVGSGKVVWDSRVLLAEGKINEAQFMQSVALSAPR